MSNRRNALPEGQENVFVYWNLHRKCWSVRHKGIVIAHRTYLVLEDVRFKVSEAGRQRVLAERKKNVHAGVQGTWVKAFIPADRALFERVSYNPYRGPDFQVVSHDELGFRVYGPSVHAASVAILHSHPFPAVFVPPVSKKHLQAV